MTALAEVFHGQPDRPIDAHPVLPEQARRRFFKHLDRRGRRSSMRGAGRPKPCSLDGLFVGDYPNRLTVYRPAERLFAGLGIVLWLNIRIDSNPACQYD